MLAKQLSPGLSQAKTNLLVACGFASVRCVCFDLRRAVHSPESEAFVLCFVVPHVNGHDFHDGAGFFYARRHFFVVVCMYGRSVGSSVRRKASWIREMVTTMVHIYRDKALSHRTPPRPPDHTARRIMAAGKAATDQLACSW
jgi:hypothetical protein